MPIEVPHPSFIHQPNGAIIVSDGTTEVIFKTVEEFLLDEPAYSLPDDMVARNFEIRGGIVAVNNARQSDGSTEFYSKKDGSVSQSEGDDEMRGYIAKVADYAVTIAERDHPFFDLPDVATAQTIADEILARQAEVVRQQFITPGDGKTLVYISKKEDVLRYRATETDGADLVDADYPWATARADRLGVSVADVIDEWETKLGEFLASGVAIENVYEQAVDDVAAATDIDAVKAIVDSVIWPVV